MANEKLKCENCGFEDELTPERLEERKASGDLGKCEQCGAEATLEDAPGKGKKNSAKSAAESKKSKADDVQTTAEENDGLKNGDAEDGESAPKGKADLAKESARQAAETAKAQFKKAFETGRKDPVFITGLLDAGLKKFVPLVTPECFDKNASRAITLGHYALLLLALASLIMGIILGIRMGSLSLLLGGAGLTVFLLLAQYVAVKSFNLFDGVIANHPSKVSGPAIVEIMAMLELIGAVAGLVMIIAGLINFIDFIFLACGILALILGLLMASVVLQADKQLNVAYDAKTSLAEQILGIIAIYLKSNVKMVPYVFGIGLTVCTVLCIPPFVISFVQGTASLQSLGVLTTLLGSAVIFTLSPILIYVFVMLLYLVIDLIKAVLNKK